MKPLDQVLPQPNRYTKWYIMTVCTVFVGSSLLMYLLGQDIFRLWTQACKDGYFAFQSLVRGTVYFEDFALAFNAFSVLLPYGFLWIGGQYQLRFSLVVMQLVVAIIRIGIWGAYTGEVDMILFAADVFITASFLMLAVMISVERKNN